jgi:radical SAM family uncharacterized protein
MMISGQRHIAPLTELGAALLEVEKPSRYLGGETGSIRKDDSSLLTIALCFPDLYEIGMSNNAIRILYSGLNAKPGVRAERVFAPAPDFEALLQRKGLPLFTLESGIALSDVDIVGFSLGFELAATSVITVLKSGQIPLRAAERGEGDPIVIAGGPAVSNPHPLASFLDAAFIGEAEAGFFELAEELSALKRSGAGRTELLGRLHEVDAVWMPARGQEAGKRARRALFGGFGEAATMTALPLPTVKTVQDHGTVEIMRGCPNGCRFCHAGYFYRPQRIKSYEVIRAEVKSLVEQGGYREITLASLSSGDYPRIGELLDRLGAEWGHRRVSFQLPSLKINSFTLPIVRKLAEVRKSGLTFAVETPVDEWQRCINKDVSFERTVAILEEARAAGFKQAKFYFMLGLPVPGRGRGEAEAILEFFARLRSRINLQINVNVGTFVPKPHTPFQWSAQLLEDEALEAINLLRSGLRQFKNIKLSYHSPFNSLLEGIIARGDERVGELILAAHDKGARLEAWEEHFDRELWRSVIADAGWPVIDECCGQKEPASSLAWDDIGVRVSKTYLQRELEKAIKGEVTSGCMEDCNNPCGACGDEAEVVDLNAQSTETAAESGTPTPPDHQKLHGRLVFRYSKTGGAAYMQHLSVIDSMDRAILISGLKVHYSEGFNPMPRFETSQPIPIAIESRCEIASLLLCEEINPAESIASLNSALPSGIHIEEARYFPIIEGKKQRSIGSLEWGTEYEIHPLAEPGDQDLYARLSAELRARNVPDHRIECDKTGTVFLRLRLPAKKEHGLLRLLEACTDHRPIQAAYRIVKVNFLAKAGDGEPMSFFEAYASLG